MTDSIKQRLIGAIVLLILFAAVAPVIFKPAKNPTVTIESQIPDAPELEVFSLPKQKQPEALEPVLMVLESSRPKMNDNDIDEAIAEAEFNEARIDTVEEDSIALTEDGIVATDSENDNIDELGDDTEFDDDIQPQSDEPIIAAVNEETNTSDVIEITEAATTIENLNNSDPSEPTISDVIDSVVKEIAAESEDENADSTQASSEPVSVQDPPLTLAHAKPKATAAAYDSELWALQLGAFGDAANAERLASQLRKENFSVVVQRRQGATRELAFVYVGPFFNIDNARSAIVDLEKADYKGKLVEFKP